MQSSLLVTVTNSGCPLILLFFPGNNEDAPAFGNPTAAPDSSSHGNFPANTEKHRKKKSFCQILMSNFAPRGPVWITGTHGVNMENAVGLVAGV